MRFRGGWLMVTMLGLLGACAGKGPTIAPVPAVDVPRFMGDWYVIAHVPVRSDRNAFDAVETYALRSDGRIQTTYRFHDGAHDGPVKTMHPVGTVREYGNGAIWGMQFFWPIKAEYVIVHLDADYQHTIVGRSKRDYVWLMARSPQMSEADYQRYMRLIADFGYDLAEVRRVPHAAAQATGD